MKSGKLLFYSVVAIVLMSLFFARGQAHAVLTKQLSYQGRLFDASGQPVPNGTYSVVFSIYNVNAGGAPLWTETQNVQVNAGGFSAYLGSVTPLAVPFNEDYFLGIKVGADPEMTPRLKLAVVGTSAFALDAANLGGQPPSSYAPAVHTHSFGSLTGAVALTPTVTQIIQATSGSVVPLGIKGQTGQSVPVFSVEDSAGNPKLVVAPDGHVLIPASNQLHVANINNDSPTGPMGNMNVDITNNAADSFFRVNNPDLSFSAKLFVEGDIQTGGNFIQKMTPGALNIKAPGQIILNASDAAAPTSVNIINDDATQVANLSVEGIVDIAGTGIKHNAPGAFTFALNDAGNTILNITNPGAGTASLQVEGATVVTSVNGIVANPSATQSIIAQNASTTPLSIKSAVSPTAPIFEVLDDASVRKFAVMPDGHVFIPGNNQLHVLNINNDSPTGPMGNISVDVMNAAADASLIVGNSDPSFKANLVVEGNVLIGNPAVTAAGVSVYETAAGINGGRFEINNASSTSSGIHAETNGTGYAVYGLQTGTGRAGKFDITNASNTSSLIHGNNAGTGSLLTLQQGGVNKFVVANNGNVSFGTANPVISATGAGANITIDANDAAASTVTITNSGTGVAKLSVEGGIDFNGNLVNSSGLATINLDIPGATNKTFVINNSLGGVANLLVEGGIAAFNGTNNVPVSNVNVQQLIVSEAKSGTCPSFVVTFPVTFTGIPNVIVTQDGGGAFKSPYVSTVSQSGFTMNCSSGAFNFYYLAIGDK